MQARRGPGADVPGGCRRRPGGLKRSVWPGLELPIDHRDRLIALPGDDHLVQTERRALDPSVQPLFGGLELAPVLGERLDGHREHGRQLRLGRGADLVALRERCVRDLLEAGPQHLRIPSDGDIAGVLEGFSSSLSQSNANWAIQVRRSVAIPDAISRLRRSHQPLRARATPSPHARLDEHGVVVDPVAVDEVVPLDAPVPDGPAALRGDDTVLERVRVDEVGIAMASSPRCRPARGRRCGSAGGCWPRPCRAPPRGRSTAGTRSRDRRQRAAG